MRVITHMFLQIARARSLWYDLHIVSDKCRENSRAVKANVF
jgi:hypothetical protein